MLVLDTCKGVLTFDERTAVGYLKKSRLFALALPARVFVYSRGPLARRFGARAQFAHFIRSMACVDLYVFVIGLVLY